jgi:hypothetical protein
MPVANYTAGLDLDTVTATGHTSVLSTDLAPTVNLTAGQARSFAATLRTNTVGTWQAVVALAVSDEDVPGATAGSPLTLTLKGAVVPAIVPPDFNTDGDVDADDFEVFAACISGPSVSATGGCESADFDGDGDVDQDDFGIFQHCFSGRDLPPYPDCAV